MAPTRAENVQPVDGLRPAGRKPARHGDLDAYPWQAAIDALPV
ncbi:hypothetical protein ACFXAS_33500 [Streptomyces sp. NPDC059459]